MSYLMKRVLTHLGCRPLTYSRLHFYSRAFSETRVAVYSDPQADLPSSALDTTPADVSDYSPPFAPTFNVAAYLNRSPTLQRLVDLGVNLNHIEKTPKHMEAIMVLDFDKDITKYLQFLDKVQLPKEALGEYITKNPLFLKEDLDDLRVRVNYLQSKLFKECDILRIVSKNPYWLSHTVEDIDKRLGFFQDEFELSGDEVRFVTVKMPKLITYSLRHVEENKFTVIEEMGFNLPESRLILLRKPKVYTLNRANLKRRFEYLHLEMGLPHDLLLNQTEVFLCRERRLKERHLFLASLGKTNYQPTHPHYISPAAIVAGNDVHFCSNVAKVPTVLFNKFLKTLQ